MTKIFSALFLFSFSLLFPFATFCQQNSIIKTFESEDENFFLRIELGDEKPYFWIDRDKGESFLSQCNFNNYHNINWDNKKASFPSKDSIESISKLIQIDPLNPKNFGLRANA